MIQLGFVPEKDVIDGILKFDSFSNFYYREYLPQKEKTPINWFLDPIRCHSENLYAYQATDSRTGNPVIGLVRLPETYDEAFMTAHEMEHVFRKLGGLSPLISPRRNLDALVNIAMRIGSMFEDPIVDLFLHEKYMFDPANHYSEDIPRSIAILNSQYGNPQSEIDKLKFVIYYTTRLLQYDFVKNIGALQLWHGYQRLFKSKLPSIAESSEELHMIIKENGYDTPEKQRHVFNKITKMYAIGGSNLCDLLYLK